jgi:hypothetical protein
MDNSELIILIDNYIDQIKDVFNDTYSEDEVKVSVPLSSYKKLKKLLKRMKEHSKMLKEELSLKKNKKVKGEN